MGGLLTEWFGNGDGAYPPSLPRPRGRPRPGRSRAYRALPASAIVHARFRRDLTKGADRYYARIAQERWSFGTA